MAKVVHGSAVSENKPISKSKSGIAKSELNANAFARLPLDIQAYVKSEIALQIKKATHRLAAEDAARRHYESIGGWIKFACYILFGIGFAIGTWLLAPSMIKKMVDERVTIPEIKTAANDVLNRSLLRLANEKMIPFERRASELQDTLRKTEADLAETRGVLSLMADLNLAQTFDRAAYERIQRFSNTNSGSYASVCKMVAQSVNQRLVNDRDPDNILIKCEVSFRGELYRGPFTMDEIYCGLRDKNAAERTVNLIRLDKHRCFYGELLDIATKAENLKTSDTALSVLEKLGAPSCSIWRLNDASNWVATASKKDPQFPSADYDRFLEFLRKDGLLAARWAAANLLPKFKDLDKTRTMAVVEALSRDDVKGVDRLLTGYQNKSGRWKQVSECYYMSATGDVSRATDMLLKCNASYPSIICVLNEERYWALGRWFDIPKIVEGLGLKRK